MSAQQLRTANYLQKIQTSTAWFRADQSMQVFDSFAAKQQKQGIDVKLPSSHQIAVGAHKRIVVWGTTRTCPGHYCKAILEPSETAQNLSAISVIPGLFSP